jgi:pyruvate-ferredoxin/flavodoxin oxidoreductase
MLMADGKLPLVIDSKAPSLPLEEYVYNETRYRMLVQSNAGRAETLLDVAKHDVQQHWEHYQQLASPTYAGGTTKEVES